MKTLFTSIILSFLSFLSFKDITAQDTTNYYTIKSKLQDFYDSIQINNPDSSGEKENPFKKWSNYWDVRLRPTGSFIAWRQGFDAYITDFINKQNSKNTVLPLQWSLIGPSRMPDDGQYSDPNGTGLGQIHYIAIDPNNSNNILACSPVGGLFRSQDHGGHWVNAGTDKGLPRCGVSSVAYDKNNSATNWFISTGNGEAMPGGEVWQNATGVWRTLDAGATWMRIDLALSIWQMRKIISVSSANNAHLFVASTNGLYECSNALDQSPSWTQVNDNYFYDVEADPTPNSTIIYAASTEVSTTKPAAIYSYNWVTHAWSLLVEAHTITGVPAFNSNQLLRTTVHISPAAPNYIFIGITQNGTLWSHLYRYNISDHSIVDKGQFISGFGQAGLMCGRALGWAVSPILRSDGELTITEGNVNPIRQTDNTLLDNSQCIWANVGSNFVHDDTHFMVFEPDGQTLWVGCDGGVYKSQMPDLINHWVERCNGLAIAEIENISVSEITDQKLAGLFDDGSLLYTKQGSVWHTKHVTGGDGHACLISPFDPKWMYTTAEASLISISSDGGDTWTYYQQLANSELAYFIMNSTDPTKLYCTSVERTNQGKHGGVWRSHNRGYNWEQWSNFPVSEITPNGVTDPSTWRVETSPTNSNYLYASWIGPQSSPSYQQKIFKSITGGGISSGDWWSVGSPPANFGWISAIAVDYNNPDHIWVSVGGQNPEGKVYSVNTTTSTWTDITSLTTKPLPPYVEVECLLHLKGSNGGIFAGTGGYGVYYTDNTMSDWEDVSGNIPNVSIDDIKINNTKGTLLTGTFGRGMWEADLPCTDNLQAIDITSNQTWSEYRRILHNITIEDGVILTITGEISLGQDAKIIVKNGGTLILDGGKLTNACHSLWNGIEVWGNNTKSQIPDPTTGKMYQGKLIIKNGGTIENAGYAVRLWNPLDYNSGGGIIQATNAIFKNNRHCAEFITYHNKNPYTGTPLNNMGYFTNCSFKTDDAYFGQDPFYGFITMWQVEGIRINGCSFTNETSLSNNTQRGYGIYTENASYNVTSYCSNTTIMPCPQNYLVPSSFEGLYTGIGAKNSSCTKSISVNGANFTNNGLGIHLQVVDNAVIDKNNFIIGPDNTCPNLTGIGIYCENCDGYSIEENSFTELTTNPTGVYSIGVRIYYIPTATTVPPNQIYKNYYSHLNVGNQAEGRDVDPNYSHNGLYYFCNENDQNIYDFYILGQGIAQYQETQIAPYLPAGNIFSHDNPLIPGDFNNQAIWTVNYYYYSGNPGSQGVPGEQPLNYFNVNPYPLTPQNPCASHFGNNSYGIQKLTAEQIAALEQDFANTQAAYNNILAIYESLKDGGSSEGTLIDINSSTPDQTMELRDNLLGKSPHLSEEILKAAADKYDVLPDPILFQILSANPDELRNEELLTYLSEKNPPLPDYMIGLLKEIAVDSTHKTALQRQLSAYEAQFTFDAYAIIRDLVQDSTTDKAALRGWLDNLHNLSADYQIVDSYLEEGNTNDAMSIVDMMPQIYVLDDSAMTEYNYYKDLKSLQTNLIIQGRNIFQLDSTQIDILQNIASSSTGIAGTQARSILEFAYGYSYIDCAPVAGSTKSSKINSQNQINTLFEPQISVYPNPSISWVAFNYNIPDGIKNSSIKIYDIKGQQIQEFNISNTKGEIIWDTRGITPGVYSYNLKTSLSSKAGKITIIH